MPGEHFNACVVSWIFMLVIYVVRGVNQCGNLPDHIFNGHISQYGISAFFIRLCRCLMVAVYGDALVALCLRLSDWSIIYNRLSGHRDLNKDDFASWQTTFRSWFSSIWRRSLEDAVMLPRHHLKRTLISAEINVQLCRGTIYAFTVVVAQRKR